MNALHVKEITMQKRQHTTNQPNTIKSDPATIFHTKNI